MNNYHEQRLLTIIISLPLHVTVIPKSRIYIYLHERRMISKNALKWWLSARSGGSDGRSGGSVREVAAQMGEVVAQCEKWGSAGEMVAQLGEVVAQWEK